MGEALEAAFHSVLTQLELVSHGTTAKVGYSTGGETDNPWPAGAKGAEHLHYRDRWANARDDTGRRRVLKDAKDELAALTGRSLDLAKARANVREETRKERDDRIVDEGEGWDTRTAALHFRCAEADIRRARREADPPREPELGKPPEGKLPVEERRARVLECFHEKGMTEGQITRLLGIGKGTVRRDLGKAA